MSKTVYVPKVIEYNDNQPLGIDGDVVGIIHASSGSRRITVLVEQDATGDVQQDGSEAPEGVELPDDYRELQAVAKEAGIKANQSKEDLREALRTEVNNE